MKRLALAACVATGLGACEHKAPKRSSDGAAPPVVVVDPVKKPSAPPVPLIDESEPDDDPAHAQPLEPGKGVRGTIGAPVPSPKPGKAPQGDTDVYSLLAPGGPDGGVSEARIELEGVAGLDLQLEALDGDGKRLQLANDGPVGEGEVIPNLALEPGRTYYLRVKALTPEAGTKPYALVVRQGPAPMGDEHEPNDEPQKATPLQALSDATGYFGRRRDEDWLLLPANQAPGTTLRVELSPVEGVAAQVRLAQAPEAQGGKTAAPAAPTVLAEARGGRGEELRLRNLGLPAGPAPAYLVLKAAEGKNTDIRWTARLQAEAPLDGAEREPNDTVARANPLAFTGVTEVAGFLWPGDNDVYRVAGAAPEGLVTVEVEGIERVDLKLERLDAAGKTLVKVDDNGPGKGEKLPPWPGGDVIVRVTARARDTAFDQPYHLTVRGVPADADYEREPNGAPAQATAWPAGPSVRGLLAPRTEEDWFRFTVPAGKSKARVESSVPGLQVRLSDEQRAPLGPALGAGRAAGPVQPGQSYLVQVKAGDKNAGANEPYTLTLTLE